jgi:hypothetical protein
MKRFMLLLMITFLLASTAYARLGVTKPGTEFGPTEQESPAIHGFAITVSDTVVLEAVPRGIYIGASGDLTVLLMGDATAVTFVGVPQGVILPIRPVLIYDTGTTATSLLGLY